MNLHGIDILLEISRATLDIKEGFPLHHALYIYHFQDIITFSGLAIGIRIRITIFYRP